jgi:hypothetical protein
MEVINCSSFLLETEIGKIEKSISLIRESLNLPNKDNNKGKIGKIVDDSVESIEKINSDREKKIAELKKKFGKMRMKSQNEYEWVQQDSDEQEEIQSLDKATQEKTKQLIQEIVPKENNPEEVKNVKKDILTQIYDDLTKGAKKLLISALVMTIGYLGVTKIFNNSTDRKERFETSDITEEIRKMLGGESEDLSSDQLKKIESEIIKYQKKGIKVVNPDDVSYNFDKSKTVFTSGNFPYKITNQSGVDIDLSDPKRKHLYNNYLPIIDEVVEEPGLKMLALSMAYFEGFEPGSVAYNTNNPGNVGNTDEGNRRNFPSLKKGVEAQVKHIIKIVNNQSAYYPVGEVVSVPPYYSKELKKTVPGFLFVYQGTLEQFLKIYATGPRDHNNYMNAILTFFNTYYPEADVKPDTKISDIIQIGRKGSSLKTLIDSKKSDKKKK